MLRTLDELLRVDDPAWPRMQGWIAHARNRVEVLDAPELQRHGALVATQASAATPLGAIVARTGGILIDHGWIRILGAGGDRLPRSLPRWNADRTVSTHRNKGFYLVADDILGGFFAIDHGGLGVGNGDVHYYAPDTLRWENLRMGYGDFLRWCFSGDLEAFYAPFRFDGWREVVPNIGGDQALFFYPFLCSAEGKDMAASSRSPTPIDELYRLYIEDLPLQIAGPGEEGNDLPW